MGGKTKSSAFSVFTLRVREIHAEKEKGGGGEGKEQVKKNLDNLLGMENLGNMQEK